MSQKLEDQRNALIKFLEISRPQGSLENRVTVIFDGKVDVYGSTSSSSVKIIFARGHSADDEIRQIVEDAANKKNIVVVTNDRGIQYAVRVNGAKVVSVQDFLAKARKMIGSPESARSINNKQPKSKESSKYITQIQAIKITTEFEKIWLKKNKQ
jgi:predicted RNA-binding protein with PIN domain